MEGYIGEMRLFGGNFAPRAWAFCNGQLLSIAQNTALFSILGTIYGGDGRTTFALPDLRGRIPYQQGTGPGLQTVRLGSRSGVEENHMNILTMAAHSHTAQLTNGKINVSVSIDTPDENAPGDAFLTQQANEFYAGSKTANQNYPLAITNLNVTLANTGNGQGINNMQPYQVLHYIICLQGVFPSRS